MPVEHQKLLNGQWLFHFTETASTNSEAMRLVNAGEVPPFWVLADRQTEGRGRSGRKWSSICGNLLASHAVRLKVPAPRAYQLALVAGVAAIDAIRGLGTASLPLRLKWPNDILVDREKVGGILIESTQERECLDAIIGIGLNITDHPRDIAAQVTHLRTYGDFPAPRVFLDVLAQSMDGWLERWQGGTGFSAVRQAWLERSGAAGEPMTVNSGDGPVTGRFQGLDEEGALILKDNNGRERRYTFGDVSLVPNASNG
jgi:BirA family biotin operon repressor/biotin-[acetyl-CoA-carboxylase] ligase